MRSGERCGGTLPLEEQDATTVAKVLKKERHPLVLVRSVGSANRTRAWRFLRVFTGSKVDGFVAGAGRLEERIAHTLTEAARPVVAGHLLAMAVVLSGFLAVGDLSGWPLAIARVLLAVAFVWLARRLGRRQRRIRVGPAPVSLPPGVSVLWLGLLPWGLAVWLAVPQLLGWLGVGLPYAVSGGLMALTLVAALVLSIRGVAEAQQASWRSSAGVRGWTGATGAGPSGWDYYTEAPIGARDRVRQG